MAEESQRLIRLVNALLTLARADARQPLKQEVIRVRPLLEDVCRQARLLAPGRSIALTEAADEIIHGDPDALRQVVLILVDNALKYTDGPVAISAEHADKGGPPAVASPSASAIAALASSRRCCPTCSSASIAATGRAPSPASG